MTANAKRMIWEQTRWRQPTTLPDRPYRDGFVEGGSDCLVCNRCKRVPSARTAWAATSTRGNRDPSRWMTRTGCAQLIDSQLRELIRRPGNPSIESMSKFLPEKFIWWLSLIGPAMVLWHREPGDTFWGHTAPWSVSLYFGFLVFVALYRWFDGFLRRKVQSYGDPLQHGIDKLKQSNLKLRKKACNTSSPEAMAGLDGSTG